MDVGEDTTMGRPFAIELGGDPSSPLVRVRGEIDVATSPQLRDHLNALLTNGARHVTIDFAEVSFVDSSGLGVLVGAYRRLNVDADAGSGGSLRVVNAQASVRKVFSITGLEPVLLDD